LKPFSGEMPQRFKRVRKASINLWLPAVILGVSAIIFGIFPMFLDRHLITAVAQSINGGTVIDISLKLWHGFNLVILLSFLTLGIGFLFYLLRKGKPFDQKKLKRLDSASPEHLTELITTGTDKFAFRYTRILHNGYLRYYLIAIILFLTVLIGFRLFTEVPLSINYDELSNFRFYEAVFFVI